MCVTELNSCFDSEQHVQLMVGSYSYYSQNHFDCNFVYLIDLDNLLLIQICSCRSTPFSHPNGSFSSITVGLTL